MADEDSIQTSSESNPSTPSPQPPSPSLGQSLCKFESFEYHESEGAYRVLYSHDVKYPSSAVVSAIAAASDTDPLDMDPLHATVDADALDSLITGRKSGIGDLRITFEYHGYEVTASSYGSLKIEPVQSNTSPPASGDYPTCRKTEE